VEGGAAHSTAVAGMVRPCPPPLYSNLIGFSSLTRVDRRSKEGKRPAMVPSNPGVTYADEGWLSWEDWLGTNKGHVAIPG
jgi:hypothetical protein